MLFIGKKKKKSQDWWVQGKQKWENGHLQTLLSQIVLNPVCMFDWVEGRRCEGKQGLEKANTK